MQHRVLPVLGELTVQPVLAVGQVMILRVFRRSIRPAVIALLRALPSPEKCGCQARKDWMIRQIEAI